MAGNDFERSFLQSDDCVTVASVTEHPTFILLFFHGLGDIGNSWASILEDLRPPCTKIICPTASRIPVSVNKGYIMPSWFDVYSLEEGSQHDKDGIDKAVNKVHRTLEEIEQSGIPSEKIIVGGISQGGALAISSVLTYPRRLGGLLVLSTWVPLHEELAKKAVDINKTIPTFHCHGDADNLVKYSYGQMTSRFLAKLNGTESYQFITYPNLGHTICLKELEDMKEWMAKVMIN